MSNNGGDQNLRARVQRLEGVFEDQYWFVSRAEAMKEANEWLARLRRDSMRPEGEEPSVLIWGPVGAGCSGFARMVHKGSRRANGPWVRLNCAEFRGSELRGQLFGADGKPGAIELAAGGTLYLEQVHCMNLEIQNELAQAMTTKTFKRVGGQNSQAMDVRWISGCWADLKKKTDQGAFSSSLFQVLCKVSVTIPALTRRAEDVVGMAQGFAEQAFGRMGKTFSGFTGESKKALEEYSWPGNDEELHVLMQRVALLSPGQGQVSLNGFLPSASGTGTFKMKGAEIPFDATLGYMEIKRRWSEGFEKEYLVAALGRHNGNVSAAAREAKIDRSNFLRLLRRYQIKSSAFRDGSEGADEATDTNTDSNSDREAA